MKRTIALLVVLTASGCVASEVPSSEVAGAAGAVSVEAHVEDLTLTSNNSCLRTQSQPDGCCTNCGGGTPNVSSIANDSSPKRACMRGYLKKKTNNLFVCPDWDGERDKCYRGPLGSANDYYRAESCFDMSLPMGDGRAVQRMCRLWRHDNPNRSGDAGTAREAWFAYWNDGSTCDVFEEGSSNPTQRVDMRANKLYSPPPAPGGNGCKSVVLPPGAVAPSPVCVDLGGGIRSCKKC